MKRQIVLGSLMILVSHFLFSQAKPYNVVFDLTSADTNNHKSVIRMIKMIKETNPDAKLEVVFYGQSLGMITKDKSIVADDIQKLTSAGKDVHFKVCEMAMKRHKIEKSQLVPGVETVPDGIYEIITKQSQGFGYIKVAQ
jgi:uncharacterized protein